MLRNSHRLRLHLSTFYLQFLRDSQRTKKAPKGLESSHLGAKNPV